MLCLPQNTQITGAFLHTHLPKLLCEKHKQARSGGGGGGCRAKYAHHEFWSKTVINTLIHSSVVHWLHLEQNVFACFAQFLLSFYVYLYHFRSCMLGSFSTHWSQFHLHWYYSSKVRLMINVPLSLAGMLLKLNDAILYFQSHFSPIPSLSLTPDSYRTGFSPPQYKRDGFLLITGTVHSCNGTHTVLL